MNNPFVNNSVISKLCAVMADLTDLEEKETIANLIKKKLPKTNEYNFSDDEISTVTVRDASCHALGVRKSKTLATEYLYSVYGIDFEFEYQENDTLYDFLCDGYFEKIKQITQAFQVTRTLVYRNATEQIRKDVIDSFDMYVTNTFIDQYLIIKQEFENKNPPPKGGGETLLRNHYRVQNTKNLNNI
jgi:hypothetical protein